MINSPPAVSRSARSSTPARRALSSSPTTRTVASLALYPTTPVTAPSPRSPTRMATAGCCRRLRHGCRVGWAPLRRHSHPPDLAGALRREAAAHGGHEKRIGQADEKWADWYAAYMVAVQAGKELPT